MSKELDYLDKILNYQPLTLVERTIIECIKEKIQHLESIDNANPSEALYELKRIDYNITYLLSDCDTIEEVSMCLNSLRDNKSCEVIKQALLKAQKDRKALDLLMQELDCKDFADLRKYARCGYEKMNKKLIQ